MLDDVSFPVGDKDFYLFRLVSLGPNLPPIQWAPNVVSVEVNWRADELIIHLRLVPTLRTREVIPSLLHTLY